MYIVGEGVGVFIYHPRRKIGKIGGLGKEHRTPTLSILPILPILPSGPVADKWPGIVFVWPSICSSVKMGKLLIPCQTDIFLSSIVPTTYVETESQANLWICRNSDTAKPDN